MLISKYYIFHKNFLTINNEIICLFKLNSPHFVFIYSNYKDYSITSYNMDWYFVAIFKYISIIITLKFGIYDNVIIRLLKIYFPGTIFIALI